MLVVEKGFLVFTTGAAVAIANIDVPKSAVLGSFVRVRIDTTTHAATSIVPAPNPLPGDIGADRIPAEFSVGNAMQQAGPSGAASAQAVAVTIEVLVPATTPSSDDVYFTTERTSFSPAELKMTRLDSQRWSIQISIPNGATVHYRFTRGTNTTAERDAAGIIPEPHVLQATAGLHTHDIVQRWADQT